MTWYLDFCQLLNADAYPRNHRSIRDCRCFLVGSRLSCVPRPRDMDIGIRDKPHVTGSPAAAFPSAERPAVEAQPLGSHRTTNPPEPGKVHMEELAAFHDLTRDLDSKKRRYSSPAGILPACCMWLCDPIELVSRYRSACHIANIISGNVADGEMKDQYKLGIG